MRWLQKIFGCENDEDELVDKLLQAHTARVAAESELPKIQEESAKLVALARRNHFGEALTLGMRLREGN